MLADHPPLPSARRRRLARVVCAIAGHRPGRDTLTLTIEGQLVRFVVCLRCGTDVPGSVR